MRIGKHPHEFHDLMKFGKHPHEVHGLMKFGKHPHEVHGLMKSDTVISDVFILFFLFYS